MQPIEEFISELSTCEFNILEQDDNIGALQYNGIKFSEGVESYQKVLNKKFDAFKSAIWTVWGSGQVNVITIVQREVDEVRKQYKDIPTKEVLETYIRDSYNGNQLAHRTVEEISFIREMSELQDFFADKALDWLSSFLPKDISPIVPNEESTLTRTKETVQKESPGKDEKKCVQGKSNSPVVTPKDEEAIAKLKQLTQLVYSSKELTQILDIDDKTLKRMRDNGEITFHKKNGGNKIWYTRDDVLEFLNKPDLTYKKWK